MGQETGEKWAKCRPKGAADSMRCSLLGEGEILNREGARDALDSDEAAGVESRFDTVWDGAGPIVGHASRVPFGW